MTDKELLTFAAKAAGIELRPVEVKNVTKTGDDKFIGYLTQAEQWSRGWFNPLTDDADALRLAVKLGLCVSCRFAFNDTHVQVNECAVMEEHGEDPYAATRRAIVRAAAAIGKDMP